MDLDEQTPTTTGIAPGRGSPTLRTDRILGRAGEVTALRAAVDAARAGRGGAIALVGEAGIGKSRLRREAERRAVDREMRVLSGRAVQRPLNEPYQPLAEALARGFAAGPPRDRELAPVMATLAQLVPSWAAPGKTPPSVLGVAEALLRLLDVAGGRSGVLLVLEDLHWADAETVRVVEYVAEHLERTRALILVTTRTADPEGVPGWLQRLADMRAVVALPVRPLSREDSTRLVLACLRQDAVGQELVSFVVDRADGVPFLVEELLTALEQIGALVADGSGWRVDAHRLAAQVPATLAGSIGRRFRALTGDARVVLSAAALLGRRFDWSLLPVITTRGEDAVLAALQEAADAGLLIGVGHDLRFRHALTCEAVRDLTLPPERRRTAARAVAALQARQDRDASRHDLIAELARIAGDPELAARHLLCAAEDARARAALATAAVRLEAAAAAAPAPDSGLGLQAREQLAQVKALSGDVDGAFELGASALAARRRCADAPGQEIDLRLALSRAALGAGRYAEATRQATEAAQLAAETGDAVRRLRAQVLLADTSVAAGDPGNAERIAAAIAASAPADQPAVADVRCAALEVLGRCQRLHDVAAAEASFAAACATAEEHGLLAWRARALHELGTIDLFDTLRTDRLLAARRAAVEVGAPATEAVAEMHLAAAFLSRGDVDFGRTSAERAATLSRRLGLALLPSALAMVARSWAQRGARREMEAVLEELADAAAGDPAALAAGWSHARTMLALHDADREAAWHALDQATRLLRAVPHEHDPHRGLWALLSTLCSGDGAGERAEARSAAGSDTRFNRSLLTVAEAVAAGRDGQPDEADRLFADAVRLLHGYEGGAWLVHLTSWLAAPAAARDGWGDPAAWLDLAVRWFGAHGYGPLATSCRVALREVGGTVPRRGRGASAVPAPLVARGVTSREVDVLRLLGDRLSNREISAALVLSHRTVEKHVTSLRAKTGRQSRRELAAFAAELHLTRDGAQAAR